MTSCQLPTALQGDQNIGVRAYCYCQRGASLSQYRWPWPRHFKMAAQRLLRINVVDRLVLFHVHRIGAATQQQY